MSRSPSAGIGPATMPTTPDTIGDPSPILRLDDVVKHFGGRRGRPPVRAVDGVSLSVGRGQTVGLVGESGSGKSTLGRLALRLLEPTTGTVTFDGSDISRLRRRELARLRCRMQLVFQDPLSSFSPRMTIKEVLTEPMTVHGIGTPKTRLARCRELLDLVGLPSHALERYPHQFSGGQAQRIGIARALTTDPDLIVCDEAVSALDVSVQAQILNLLREVQRELGLSYLFIAHDLNVVRYMSDHISVMYLGQVVESGPADALMDSAMHPYTQALVESVPSLDQRGELRAPLVGEIPSPTRPPAGCRFHTRCPRRFEPCDQAAPELLQIGERSAACHLLTTDEETRA
ncbi:ABC transporter ATP-binding protein [Aeromicrobium sp. CTD01-1L150]|uniref:ABC transporter ATP-binding protein n=1 Tax=Aeromicrobium sp. CTD01-1L150 TaxID=3341830 RepID=UPI0035C228B9